jgi:hypothetical protein
MPPEETTTEAKPETKTEAKAEAKTEAKKSGKKAKADAAPGDREAVLAAATARLAGTGRNDACPCGSGKKYKKCHLIGDEAATAPVPEAPDPKKMVVNAWSLFEQRRPGAAEREFRAALALDPSLTDARVGIGMARLSANDVDAAKTELGAVVTEAEKDFAKLRADNVKDAFTRPEAQPIIRASHALGCLAYDQDRFADAYVDLERVFSIDEGAVGTEARLIAGKALMKENKAAESVAVLEPAVKAETGGGRAHMGLALAHFVAGAEAKAKAALSAALEANSHFGKAVLGRIRRHVENVAGTQPGTIEEALVYAQTYGDAWTDDAKAFLVGAIDDGAHKPARPPAEPESAATP